MVDLKSTSALTTDGSSRVPNISTSGIQRLISMLDGSNLTVGADKKKGWGAAVTEFNFTFLLEFYHVGLVRAATEPGVFDSPVLVIALGKFVVILLCTFAGAASGAGAEDVAGAGAGVDCSGSSPLT